MSRSNAGNPGVNLMPLLDVLLCTMGTLIIILGIINREARLHPAKRLPGTPASASAQAEEMASARDDLRYRIDELAKSRDKTLADLENSRTRLAGIESHSRQLEDQLRSLSDAAKQLQNTTGGSDSNREALRSQLMQLDAKRMELENDLKKARYQAANRQPVYAVVPFEGLYKTNRRPIYIECRNDSVILQPEGIVFTPTDFLGPGGPGNPLASALRAAQEYWRAAPRPSPNMPNEPYPLLLVRPNGIIAYYLVRDAMTSWDAEFGYELVGQDWQLDFPMQPDAQLREMETRAVADARQRLEWLAQASPDSFARKSSKVQYHVSPFRGGAVRDGGPSLGNDPFADDPLGGFGRSPDGGKPNGGFPNGGNSNSAFPNGGVAGGADGRGDSTMPGGGGSNGLNDGRGQGGLRGGSAFGFGPGGVADGGGMSGGNGPMLGEASGGADGNDRLGGGTGNLGGQGFGGGTGQAMSSGGPDIAQVGPRYAGTGGANGNGMAGGMPNGNGLSGGTANGIASNNTGTGDTRFGSTQGPRGSGSLSPNQYGYTALPGASGGSPGAPSGTSGSAAGAMSGSAGMSGASANQFGSAGGMAGSVGSSGMSSGGAPSIGGAGSPSGNSSLGQAGGDANQSASAGMPSSMSFDMSPQQQQQPQFDSQLQQNQSQSSQRNQSRNAAKYRGKDWALPNMRNASVPVQRPIRVECWSDRLVLLPDTRDQQAQVIPFGDRTDDAVDELVAAVQNYTKSWGMAGRGMYWKPQLVLNVNADADARAADLQNILANSGWDVKRR